MGSNYSVSGALNGCAAARLSCELMGDPHPDMLCSPLTRISCNPYMIALQGIVSLAHILLALRAQIFSGC